MSGSKTFFQKIKVEEIQSERVTHYEKYEDEYIVNYDENMCLINEMRRNLFKWTKLLKQTNQWQQKSNLNIDLEYYF